MSQSSLSLSVIIPALNEEAGISQSLERVKKLAQEQLWELDLLVIDDGSRDQTARLATEAGARVIRHPSNGGYGLSLQHGIEQAKFEIIAITDADGTYPVEELPELVAMITEQGFDMAVGARQGSEYKKGWWKYPARIVFRCLSEYVAGRHIPDINSGLRVMKREKLIPHYRRTCLGFSFTTSITLIFFLNGYFVGYRPIQYSARIGKSKVRHFHDTLRTAQILISIISFYNPLKLYLLIALMTLLAALICGIISLIGGLSGFAVAAAALVAAIPLIFGLGCLAEMLRIGMASRNDS